MTAASAATYTTVARVGPPSENRIHDDDIARAFGFTGGLVPGVSVYAYLSHPVVERFGLPFLERGEMEVRLLKPFYDGETVSVHLEQGQGGRVDLRALNPAGDICAAGWAALPAEQGATPLPIDLPPVAPPDQRPVVSTEGLAEREFLGTLYEQFDTAGNGAAYLAEVPDGFAAYHGSDPVAPTGFLIRRANSALVGSFVLPAWVHVSSRVQHLGLLHAGEVLETRSRIRELFERKGHRFVRLDVLMLGNDERPVMYVDHVAIYRLRGA